MIIKKHKRPYEVFISFLILIIISVLFYEKKNIEIFIENYREKVLTYDIGISRFSNVVNKEGTQSEKVFSFIKKTPSLIYKNIIGFERPPIENLHIKIDFLDYKKIFADRDLALKNMLLKNPSEVKAEIEFQGKTYEAKVRLKGDLPDHWESIYRMSLRIDLKGGETILGLNEFNIQKPRTRLFPYDPVFQDLMRSMGNLSVKHNLVKVKLNGQNWGFMDLESHVGKEFLERSKRKESLVVRFSNEEGWYYLKRFSNPALSHYRISDPILYSRVYTEGRVFTEIDRKRYSYIVNQRLSKGNIYDVDSYSRLLFLARLWGDIHVLYENNIKHYFNPYTLKLEPISSDQYEPKDLNKTDDPFNLMGECLSGYVFLMNEPYQLFKESVEYKISLKDNFERALKALNEAQGFFERYHDFFPLEDFPNTSFIKSNKKLALGMGNKFFTIKDACEPNINSKVKGEWKEQAYELDEHLKAYHYDDGKIKIYNLIPDRIKLLEIRTEDGISIPLNKDVEGYKGNLYEPNLVETGLKGFLDDKIEIISEHNGSLRSHKLYKTLFSDPYNPFYQNGVQKHKFIVYKGKGAWEVSPGTWRIDEPLVINGNLEIKPGTNLLFNSKSYLIVKGQLLARGLPDNGITLTSVNDSWKGLYVLQSEDISILEQVSIKNTSSLNHGLLDLTGGVTFYEADVNIKDSYFINSRAEDMLNLVKSKYTIDNLKMMNASSDAIDSDFSDGKIKGLTIENVAGDALDTSGSYVDIDNFEAREIKDKALSVGESSRVNIQNCKLSSIGVGIASKDGSKVKVSGCEIRDYKLASLMSYVKKNYYSSPSLTFSSTRPFDSSSAIRQIGTDMIIDGNPVKTSNLNVDELYNSTFMKK